MARGSVDDGYRFRVWAAHTSTAVSAHAWAWEAMLWAERRVEWHEEGTAPTSEQARSHARRAIGRYQQTLDAMRSRMEAEWETVQ